MPVFSPKLPTEMTIFTKICHVKSEENFARNVHLPIPPVYSYCLLHTRDSELRKVLETKTKKKKRKLSDRQQDEHARPATSKQGPGRPAGVRNYTKRPKVLELGSVY